MGTYVPPVFLVATAPSASSCMSLHCVGFNKCRIYRDTAYECNNSLIRVEINMNNDNVKLSLQVSNVSCKYQDRSTSVDVVVRRSVVTYGKVLRHIPHMQNRKCLLSVCV